MMAKSWKKFVDKEQVATPASGDTAGLFDGNTDINSLAASNESIRQLLDERKGLEEQMQSFTSQAGGTKGRAFHEEKVLSITQKKGLEKQWQNKKKKADELFKKRTNEYATWEEKKVTLKERLRSAFIDDKFAEKLEKPVREFKENVAKAKDVVTEIRTLKEKVRTAKKVIDDFRRNPKKLEEPLKKEKEFVSKLWKKNVSEKIKPDKIEEKWKEIRNKTDEVKKTIKKLDEGLKDLPQKGGEFIDRTADRFSSDLADKFGDSMNNSLGDRPKPKASTSDDAEEKKVKKPKDTDAVDDRGQSDDDTLQRRDKRAEARREERIKQRHKERRKNASPQDANNQDDSTPLLRPRKEALEYDDDSDTRRDNNSMREYREDEPKGQKRDTEEPAKKEPESSKNDASARQPDEEKMRQKKEDDRRMRRDEERKEERKQQKILDKRSERKKDKYAY